MILNLYRGKAGRKKALWDNMVIYDQGSYLAIFNSIYLNENKGYGLDIYRSPDGVHWQCLGQDIFPLQGAHAGYGFTLINDQYLYYPTCTDACGNIHFKVCASTNLISWTDLGEALYVCPDRQYYDQRWDEMVICPDIQDGNAIYWGYITSEVRDDAGAPSCGLLRSEDGIHWEVLPPPVIDWGRIPPQHMEVNFCEIINGSYYLNLSGRLYLDSMGYSLYTFVADSPYGPFVPDSVSYRLCGTSLHDMTYLAHTFRTPDDLLCALWLSCEQYLGREPEIPSTSFALSPLKRLALSDGHLRLAYWPGNDLAQVEMTACSRLRRLHPVDDSVHFPSWLDIQNGRITIDSGRDGVIYALEQICDRNEGFALELQLLLQENRASLKTHHHSACFGIYLSTGEQQGTAMIFDTHGVARTGKVTYAERPLAGSGLRQDQHAAVWIHEHRAGKRAGTLVFTCEDTTGPYGHASAPDLRHGYETKIRLLAKGDFFECYVNDYYVQTFVLPPTFTGQIALIVAEGQATCRGITISKLDYSTRHL